MRAASFAYYPCNEANSPFLLAKSGFVYTGDGTNDKVRCFFCLMEVENWQDSDNMDQVHQSLNPSCPRVILKTSSNAAPNIYSISDANDVVFSSDVPLNSVLYGAANIESGSDNVNRLINTTATTDTSANGNISVSEESTMMPICTENGSSTSEEDDRDTGRKHSRSADLSNLSTFHQTQMIKVSQSSMLHYVEASSSTMESAVSSSDTPPAHGQILTSSNRMDPTNSLHPITVNNSGNYGGNMFMTQTSFNRTGSDLNISTSLVNQHSLPPRRSNFRHPVINSKIYAIPAGPHVLSDSSSSTDNIHTLLTESNGQPTNHQSPKLTYKTLNILYERPKYLEFAVLQRRLASFEDCQEFHTVKFDDLAKAGLSYVGYGDCCKCFFCGGGLRNWKIGDDPFVEHARWFKKCRYIRQCMGQEFMDAVGELKSIINETITYNDVVEHMRKKGQELRTTFDDWLMTDDAAVKALVQEGYTEEEVTNAVLSLKQNGVVPSVDVILKKIKEDELSVYAHAAVKEDKSDDESIHQVKEEIDNLRRNLLCKICLDNEVRMVFLPCGHFTTCQECAWVCQDCPVCRRHIRGSVRASFY